MLLPYLLLLIVCSCNQPAPKTATDSNNNIVAGGLHLQLITDKVQSPVAMAVAGDGSNRLFICQKEGKAWVIQDGRLLSQPFIDVTDQMVDVNPGYDERGLLGMAFHPNFKTNHKFYIYYSAPSQTRGSDHKSIIAEFKVSSSNPNLADKSTKKVVMEIEEPESNHNGGNMAF